MISSEYIILLFVIMIAVWRQSKFWTVASMAFMLLLAVCREKTVGTDFLGYHEDFLLIHNVENAQNIIYHNFEIGFIWMIYLFKRFSNDFLLFGSLIFLPFFFGCVKLIKESKVNLACGLFVLYTYGLYFSGYNIMRQMMCIGFVLFFIGWLYRCKYWHFAAAVLVLSVLFHKSSVIMLVLIPIHYYVQKIQQIDKKVLYIAVVVSFALYYLGANYFVGIFSTIVGAVGLDYGGGYLRTEGEGGNMVSLMYTLLALIVIYCKNPATSKFPTYTFVSSIVLFNLLNIMPTFASRAFWGLFVFCIVLIPDMLADRETQHKRFFAATAFVFGLGYFFYAYYFNNYGEINPYVWR